MPESSLVIPQRDADTPGAETASVLIVTYNQEQYLRHALDSVLMQRADFGFEIVIADDCSTDSTPEIIEEYRARYPQLRVLPTPQHLGISQNYRRGFAAGRGKYIAVLEGDDYWILRHKLDAMVRFLDEHSECAFCFHRVFRHDEVSDQTVAVPVFEPPGKYQTLTARLLAAENFIGGFSTCMYRRDIIAKLDPGIWKLKIREWPFNIVMAQHGLIGYLPEIMSVYRAHRGGIWSLKSPEAHFDQLLEILDPYNEFLGFKYDAEFQALKLRCRPMVQPPVSRLRRWIKPFVPPILVSLARKILI